MYNIIQKCLSYRRRHGVWETVRNIGWMSIGRAIRMSGSLVVGTMVVRYLGPSSYGLLSYATALYGIFNILSNLGLDILVVGEIVLAPSSDAEEEILGTAFLLKGAASILTSCLAVLYSYLMEPRQVVVTSIVAMLSVASILQAFDVVDYFYQAKTQSRRVVLPQLVAFIISNVLRIIAVIAHGSLMTFGVIAAAEIAAYEISLAIAYFADHKNMFRWNFRGQRAISLFKASWPIVISSVLVTIYMRTDQVLLGILSTPAMVGQYSAAVKISEIWYIVPSIIGASIMPRLLKYRDSSPLLYQQRMQKLYAALAAGSFVVAALTSLFGRFVVQLLFGTAYKPAAAILALHVWTGPFVFLGVISSIQLIHEELTHIILQRSIVGAVANVGLNVILIPHFGGMGSAAATLIAQVLAAYLLDACNRTTRHIFRMKTFALLGLWILFTKDTSRSIDV